MTRDPKDPFETMQREVERLWRDLVYHRHPAAHFADQAWSPPADVVVAEASARVILELAGVPRESVRVRLRGNTLEVSGRRTPPIEPVGHHYHRAEIYFGEFRRVVELPWQADPEQVTALYHDGMLEIRLHAAPVTPRTEVEIQGENR
jgi:HSP20 family protein